MIPVEKLPHFFSELLWEWEFQFLTNKSYRCSIMNNKLKKAAKQFFLQTNLTNVSEKGMP